MQLSEGTSTLRQFIQGAGFSTLKAFATAAGLEDYEISRILSEKSPRRPTGAQLRKMATTLGKRTEELATLLLPPGGLDQEVLEDVVAERDQLLNTISELRGEHAEVKARLAAAEEQIANLGRDNCEFFRKIEQLEDDYTQEKNRSATLLQRKNEAQIARANHERQIGELQILVAQKQHMLEDLRQSTATELAELYKNLQLMRDERGRDQVVALQKQIMAGTLGAAVGALITGAARSAASRSEAD